MAPWTLTSQQKNAVPLLPKYKCKYCNKFKDNVEFSNNELNQYRTKAATGKKLSAVTAGLRCRNCTGDQIHELHCAGPCGAYKSHLAFSKSARGNGGSGWCESCTLWKEAQDPTLPAQAPPQALIAPDEDQDFFAQESRGNATGYASDPEAGDYSDDEYDNTTNQAWGEDASTASNTGLSRAAKLPASAPVQQNLAPPRASRPANTPSFGQNQSDYNAPGQSGLSTTIPSSSTRGHPTASQVLAVPNSIASSQRGVAPGTRTAAGSYAVPTTDMTEQSRTGTSPAPVRTSSNPWARGIVSPDHWNAQVSAAASAMNQMSVGSQARPHTGSTPSNPYQTSSPARPGQRPAPNMTSFNAWDPNGVQHVQSRADLATPSEVDSTGASTGNHPTTVTRDSKWAKITEKTKNHRTVPYIPAEHQGRAPIVHNDDDDDF